MNNQIALNRINQQTVKRIPRVKINEFQKPQKHFVTPVSQDKLKNILMEELQKQEKPQTIISSPTERLFVDITDFVSWYETVKDKFSESQKKALETLVSANKMIFSGCGCQKNSRYNRAQEYFKTFWEQNKGTDMPVKVAEILQVKTLKFNKGDTFLTLNF